MRTLLLVFNILLFATVNVVAKEKDKAAAIKKEIDKENERYEKTLAKYPKKAETYWNHATVLCTFRSECMDARAFYEKAVSLDSSKPALFREYGMYLLDKLMDVEGSRSALLMAVKLTKEDDDIHKYLEKINRITESREKEAKLRDFGHSTIHEIAPTASYTEISSFDSLRKVTADPTSKFYYKSQLARFLADDATLTAQEMYMLIVGYSTTPDYNPFNYAEISTLKVVASINSDTAIAKGNVMIATNPINPSLNREIMYAYRRKNDTENANRFQHRIQLFFDGMLYSGNGTCTRPFVSLWSKEEYNLITYLGYKPTENHSMESCAGQMAEKIEMTNPNDKKAEFLFFNVRLIYMQSTGK